MRLHALRLQNFRQHADTRLVFERGLTGIIGPNGAGKSTVLEAIAWALYGNAAARGTRETIRFSRATDRAPVHVILDFELAGHRYRVERGLTRAECFLDDGATPIASTISGVNELLQRRLGMSRTEFFHTYFTGQKELDVMVSLGAADRARFLSRVLGYDRLSSAQELVRDRRRALMAEATGLKQGMPDANTVSRQLADAAARIAMANARADHAAQALALATAELALIAPQWVEAQSERERGQLLASEFRMMENELLSLKRDLDRLDRELALMARAQLEVAPLMIPLQSLPLLRQQLTEQDALAGADATRQVLLERRRGLEEDLTRLAERAGKLESAPQLEREGQAQLATIRETQGLLDKAYEDTHTAWVRDKQEAETRLEALRTQYTELASQRDTLEGLGADSPCPTCGRALGASWRNVLDLLSEQLDTVQVDGNYYRQRVEQLLNMPEPVHQLDERRRHVKQEAANNERRLVKIQGALAERNALGEQRASISSRLEETREAMAALTDGYVAHAHVALREDVARLAEIETRVARLSGQIEREASTRLERARVEAARAHADERLAVIASQRQTLSLTEAQFLQVRATHEQAATGARRAELEAVSATGDVARASAELDAAGQRRDELLRLEQRLEDIESERRMHDELDRTYNDLRTDLNFQLRPELSEIASEFLKSLTNGRYEALEFDEDYNLVVLEGGLPKPVISGGEEDLCNLVLRLAISQMIADRAGQSFSLLILDEVFGSLDDARRDNVMELLRRLQDRFEQVIVITHIEQVREGLDRLLLVRFNEETGAAVVTDGSVPDVGNSYETDPMADELVTVTQ